MTPAVERGFIDEQQQLERQLARQMGCMAGFFHIFDRQQMLTGKRIYTTRRLPSSPGASSTSPSDVSDASSVSALKDIHPSPPEEVPARSSVPLPLPVFDIKDGLKPWKLRESPRLSLDSRAVVDAKGKLRPRDVRTSVSVPSSKPSDTSDAIESETQRRSPSVVARLMGLDALPDAGGGVESNRAELRRSASESRVSRDPSYYRSVDTVSFEKTSLPISKPISAEEFFRRTNVSSLKRMGESKKADPPLRTTSLPPLQRKIYFEAEDFFPEPKRSASLYGEIEKRLRRRGIDEPARDLETLKQILEALQLKGLLHSKPSDHLTNARRNLIYDNDILISRDSPIVVMRPTPKPSRLPISQPSPGQYRSSPSRRRSPVVPENLSPIRRDRSIDRSFVRGNDRRIRAPRSPESPQARRRPSSSPEPQRTPQPNRRISAVNSPRTSPKRVSQDPVAIRSPRIRRPVQAVSPKSRIYLPAEDDNATTVSESSASTNSQFDFERPRSDDYRNGRSLLERCDKLMSSIAAFTAGESITAPDQQPSPVSVLDSSPYLGGGECSPSPAIKRSIDFKDDNRFVDWDEDQSEAATPTAGSNESDDSVDVAEEIDNVDYAYVARIFRTASDPRLESSSDEIFAALEKRCYPSDSSTAARLHRRLVFDTVAEILDHRQHPSPWEAFARARSFSAVAGGDGGTSLRQLWTEVGRIKEQAPNDDLNDVTCGAIMKDMAGDHLDGGEWGPQPAAEMCDAVLRIERLIFKDLIADSIRQLADISVKSCHHLSRRKLMF